MSIAANLIAENLERLRNEIADTCARAHRDPSTVALMAVSKMHPAEAILEAHAAGQRLFGENRVQEWQSKHTQLASLFDATRNVPPAAQAHLQPSEPWALSPEPWALGSEPWALGSEPWALGSEPWALGSEPCFHLIGPLQNNKTAKAAELFDAIDTLDSLKTAQRLDRAAAALGKTLPVLLEVKLSPEETKHGVAPQDLSTLLHAFTTLDHIKVHGLMTVPPWSENPETARPYFQQLRRLRDELQPNFPTLNNLSMGMSNDFRVAIEEGSTTVRLGAAIFGPRHPPS